MVQEPEQPAEPVSMSKEPAGGAPATPDRPRVVTAAVVAMALAGLAAFGAAIALYGQRSWLTTEQLKANSNAVSRAVTSAAGSASSSRADVSAAKASASASATKNWPLEANSKVHDQVSQQQTGALIMTLLVLAALVFLTRGVYRGRHWSRWGVVVFWVFTSLTGMSTGLLAISAIGSSAPAAVKVPAFLAAGLMVVAVVLVNLPTSTAYFALSRPATADGRPARRGLFAPRTPPARAAGRSRSVLTSSAADRGEAYIQKQRAKKRATGNAEAIAKGAELARNRAKASKSRRTEK